MDIEILQKFFFWCMFLNTGIYALTAIAALVLRDFLYTINNKLLGLDKETVSKSIQTYLATYKLLITVFNFVPWIALLIIK
ncbi:MAG: DUF6868 family protein [bacterium]